MTIQVLLFAQAKQIVGKDSVKIKVDSDSSVADLRSALSQKHPELATLLSRSNIAVNQQYSAESDLIPDGAEVAMIPPVSGG
jgi:molybdopterin converting factor subunit 1